ncbi:hypothetical protein BDQ17DRAFT_1362798 [Cyathus striatus]|nr:hypothetical protein BDQ17DRAFT_1362798 [Cyathus striatus]
MSLVGANCAICFESHRLNQFLILPCGHAHCTNCTEKLAGTSRHFNCPSCRAKIPRAAPHKICLDVIDSKTFFATDVIDKVNQMDGNSKLNTVEKAVEKITKASKIVKHDEELVRRLLEAIERFKELVPGFQRAEKAETELFALRRTFEENEGNLAAKARRTQALENENETLKRKLKLKEDELKQADSKVKTVERNWDTRLKKAEEERDTALTLAEKATSEFVQMKEDNTKLLKSMEEIANTNKIHKRQLEWYISKNSAQSKEIATLKEQWSDLQTKLAEKEQEKENLQSQCDNQWYGGHDNSFNEYSLELDVEGMPPSQFGSAWQTNKPHSMTKRNCSRGHFYERKYSIPNQDGCKRKTVGTVQTGPRAMKRVRIL